MSYEGVMRLAREHPPKMTALSTTLDWLKVVKGCYEEAIRVQGGTFAGDWVADKVGFFPGLRMLQSYGILSKEYNSRQGKRAYWTMPDIEGVGKALHELGYINMSKGLT